ncbi:MAG: isoprenylcysteine carboxylmethyltransferase family protein [Patescibacteria group bacterium]|nr:isoprenylcysteine carboxylmethyltransferase family protein [Patescibacteria group bacterium]
MNDVQAYNLWPLVIISSAIFIIFAFSFTKPKTARDWRSFSMFSAFIVALFTEMYGFPLTIYLFSGWLSDKFPGMSIYSHDMGHLWQSLFGFKGDPHFSPLHILSYIFIGGGFIMLSSAWEKLYKAQKKRILATTGLYARIRHPQYVGFVAIMFGFLLQWPTLVTLVMFPVLVFMYIRLANQEEKGMIKIFSKEYEDYKKNTPAFIPKILK